MPRTNNYDNNPRDYALALVEDGHADAYALLMACLKFMSNADVQAMLDANELSPRFIDAEW